MSKVLSGIGKIFKKVLKVAKVVLPIALAAAAVVFTGGAALGLLPTFAGAIGGVVGGLGLSAGVATALTGAIAGAGFGAATGGVLSGLTGGNVLKGMQTGALTGAVTGGLMPSAVPGVSKVAQGFAAEGLKNGAVDIAKEGLKNVASSAVGSGGLLQASSAVPGVSGFVPGIPGVAAAPSTLPSAALDAAKNIAPKAASAIGSVAPTAVSTGTQAATTAAAAIPTGTGGLLSNPLLASQLLTGVSSAFAPNESKQTAKARTEAEQEMGYYAYGGGDSNGKKAGGLVQGVYSGNAKPFGTANYGTAPAITPGSYFQRTSPRWQWDPATSTVKEVSP